MFDSKVVSDGGNVSHSLQDLLASANIPTMGQSVLGLGDSNPASKIGVHIQYGKDEGDRDLAIELESIFLRTHIPADIAPDSGFVDFSDATPYSMKIFIGHRF